MHTFKYALNLDSLKSVFAIMWDINVKAFTYVLKLKDFSKIQITVHIILTKL